jgi:hypothetical protein
MVMKICFGVVVLAMVASFYYKLKIIYNSEDLSQWHKKYRANIYILFIVMCALNTAFVSYEAVQMVDHYHKYFEGTGLI